MFLFKKIQYIFIVCKSFCLFLEEILNSVRSIYDLEKNIAGKERVAKGY